MPLAGGISKGSKKRAEPEEKPAPLFPAVKINSPRGRDLHGSSSSHALPESGPAMSERPGAPSAVLFKQQAQEGDDPMNEKYVEEVSVELEVEELEERLSPQALWGD
jgi:hypothetical protein